MRGQLNDNVIQAAKNKIGRSISLAELRLIPYVQYVMVNDQKIEPMHIKPEERKILSQWRKEGYIEGGASGLSVTKEFWDLMCEVLFYSYVDIEGLAACVNGQEKITAKGS